MLPASPHPPESSNKWRWKPLPQPRVSCQRAPRRVAKGRKLGPGTCTWEKPQWRHHLLSHPPSGCLHSGNPTEALGAGEKWGYRQPETAVRVTTGVKRRGVMRNPESSGGCVCVSRLHTEMKGRNSPGAPRRGGLTTSLHGLEESLNHRAGCPGRLLGELGTWLLAEYFIPDLT